MSPADLDPFLSLLKWTADGLIPAIVQDAATGDVLMMAWMDDDAVRQTLATGQTHFYSRSRRSRGTRGRPRDTSSTSSRSGSIATPTSS